MPREVEVRPVVNTLELTPAHRKQVLDVHRILGVVRQLVGPVGLEPQPVRPDAQRLDPLQTAFLPGVVPFLVRAGLDEELHFHLLEFARPKREVPRRNLVSEGLAHLCDPERNLLTRTVEHVPKIDVDPLCGLRPQIHRGCRILHRPHEGLEHEIEIAGLGELTADSTGGALIPFHVVGPEATVAISALDQGVREPLDVAAGHPHLGVHQDSGVEALDVLAPVHHLCPPGLADVVLQFDAEGAVVIYRPDAAIDLG